MTTTFVITGTSNDSSPLDEIHAMLYYLVDEIEALIATGKPPEYPINIVLDDGCGRLEANIRKGETTPAGTTINKGAR